MSGSHVLDRWLESHGPELRTAGVSAVAGRAPAFLGRPSATWISFETARAAGRAVLWSSGRCQLDATSTDGSRLCATERIVTTSAELDDALGMFTGHLRLAPRP
jgi:hypothetical protein